ncbi:hypothetical protein DFJ58DRAFT_914589 [Suillus subalutaceus]|uniref:uncharacterized protein n=1 Tax=Suillus subalutaceus TaxID=48586 RepID=UPI001B865E1B|nr:uncharacterized protein DFJ58DRAFT_914589 [Suillus subalutaceus]KAG1851055.1 hypothetical protein DFJ58DRAFT_914589 [Suillus subalutaceus]
MALMTLRVVVENADVLQILVTTIFGNIDSVLRIFFSLEIALICWACDGVTKLANIILSACSIGRGKFAIESPKHKTRTGQPSSPSEASSMMGASNGESRSQSSDDSDSSLDANEDTEYMEDKDGSDIDRELEMDALDDEDFGFQRAFCDQYPVGPFLPVSAPALWHVMENFPYMSRNDYAAIAGAHFCVNNLVVFELLKTPWQYFAHQMMPDPFSVPLQPVTRSQVPWLKGVLVNNPLVSKSPRQPINSLANFQYYVHEWLPPVICSAFSEASIYDLMLVSRARVSQIVHHYAYKSSFALHWTAEETSQQYNKGNITYQHSGVSYSQENMDSLFDDADGNVDCAIPRALQICHLPADVESSDDVDDHVEVTDGCGSVEADVTEYVMEAMGYTKGGFYHSGRTRQQYLSMEAQVKNLLLQDDLPFRVDANFAFICWNMIQKKEDLKDIAPTFTLLAEKWSHSTGSSPSTTEEKKAARILRCLQASTKFLRGSAGYKLCRRNEIRALMKKFCTPAIFVIVNPHDLTSSVIPVLTGIELNDWMVMGSFERTKVVAERPDAAAIAFDMQIKAFIDIIIRYKHGPERYTADVKKPSQGKQDMDPHLEKQPQLAELDDQSFQMCLDSKLQEQTMIDEETGFIELQRWHGHVNSFTDLILYLMQCNTDTQFIGSGEAAKAAVFYITEYITKGDVPMYVGLQALDYATKMHEVKYVGTTDMNDTRIAQKLITKSVNAMMGRQEMSHQQVMSCLVGGGDHYTSHTFQVFKWFEFTNAVDKFECDLHKSDNQGVENDNEPMYIEEAVTVDISAEAVDFASDIQDYICRPEDENFGHVCHWEFVEYTIKVKGKIIDQNTSAAIPRPDGSTEDYEIYCRAILLLFTPWHTFEELKNANDTWADTFERQTFALDLCKIIHNMHVENECKDARDAHAALVIADQAKPHKFGFTGTEEDNVEEDMTAFDEALFANTALDPDEVEGGETYTPETKIDTTKHIGDIWACLHLAKDGGLLTAAINEDHAHISQLQGPNEQLTEQA